MSREELYAENQELRRIIKQKQDIIDAMIMAHTGENMEHKEKHETKEKTMIKFKEQDGMLFRMLEEPVPLTPDAKMPVLVRLIQDDSPMGRLNKRNYDESLNKIECATGYNKML
ncbi:MAG: hypothetical protein M0Q12_04795, partial [Synergistaceae bacterium]|nr:hypothetical protein [Synergistaceae bacterium]